MNYFNLPHWLLLTKKLHAPCDIQLRFSNLIELDIPELMADPFENNADTDTTLQEYLIHLHSDETAQAKRMPKECQRKFMN